MEGRSYIAVTNVGVRPTVEDNDGRVTVEGFILDFDGDLYGKELRMEFYHRIRGERKFPSLQELSQEIRRNAEETGPISSPRPRTRPEHADGKTQHGRAYPL